jgi:hypothetical protein
MLAFRLSSYQVRHIPGTLLNIRFLEHAAPTQDVQGCIHLDNAMVGDAEARLRRPLSTFAVLV